MVTIDKATTPDSVATSGRSPTASHPQSVPWVMGLILCVSTPFLGAAIAIAQDPVLPELEVANAPAPTVVPVPLPAMSSADLAPLEQAVGQTLHLSQSRDPLPAVEADAPFEGQPPSAQPTPPQPRPPSAQPTAPLPSATPGPDPRFPLLRQGEMRSPFPRSSASPYLLGTGDTIAIDIFDVPEFSDGQYIIGVDGSINLPWVGPVFLEGQTLSSASRLLEQTYAPFIRDPLIVVTLIQARPLRVSVVGEVNRPGSYTLSPDAGATSELGEGVSQWTTAINAIQQAGGITQLANVRDIEIRRGQTLPGEESVIEVNLWEFLQTGSLPQDITLRDGDTVVVPRVSEINQDELGEIAIANFSPLFINTYIVGEVQNPGVQALPPNSSLNQALLAAGGRVSNRAGRVDLIRVNLDGSVERRRMSINFSDPVNDETNPPLRNNDIVVVRRSTLAGIFDGIEFITAPIRNVFGLLDGVLDVRDRIERRDNVNDDDDDDDDDDVFNPPDPDDPPPNFGL